MNEELMNDLDYVKALLVKANIAAKPQGPGRTPTAGQCYEMLYYIDQARLYVDALHDRVKNGEE